MNTSRPAPRHRAARVRDESSNSFAMFIVMLPIIMGAFGMGLDFSRNVYIRTTLQNALDMATVSGAGVTEINSQGRVDIVNGEALRTVERIYAINRSEVPMDCWGDGDDIEGTTLNKCWRESEFGMSRDYLTYGVRERSQNAFLTVIGVKWQRYDIVSNAAVNQDQE